MPSGIFGSVPGWPLLTFSQGRGATGVGNTANNRVAIWGMTVPYRFTFGSITCSINATDAVNSYDLGIYTQAGTLIANIGARTLPSLNSQTFTFQQGTQTIGPGNYIFAMTGTATTAKIYADNNGNASWVQNTSYAPSSGGALPSSISTPAVSLGVNLPFFTLF